MRRFIAAALAVCIMLAGCGVIKDTNQQGRPIPVKALDMSSLGYPGRVEKLAVYFHNTTSKTLTAETRTIVIDQDDNPAEVAVKELLKGPSNDGMLAKIAPEGMTLDQIEFSRDAANVYLLYNGQAMQPKEKFILEQAIANTVTDILGTAYTSVFYNGMQAGFLNQTEQGVASVPYAPLTKHTGLIEDAWVHVSAKYAEVLPYPDLREPEEEQPMPENETDIIPETAVKQDEIMTVLYYISADGGFILPEVRNVTYTEGSYVETLIAELGKRPLNPSVMTNPLADGLELIDEPAMMPAAGGGYTLRLNFTKIPARYYYSGTNEALLSYAAMAYTITGFVPGIKDIEIYVNGVKAEIADQSADTIERKNYLGVMGSSVPLYFADKNSDLLLEVPRSMEQGKTWSARARLLELIKGPLAGDGDNAWPLITSGITEDDILSVDVYSDTAYVNLSRKFKEDCVGLSSKNEMLLVYSIVNTITAMDGISKVQFLVEGEQTDTLAGNICISNPFLKNYGIIKQGG